MSVEAINRALAGDRMILTLLQRNDTDEPGPDDLHKVGTVCIGLDSPGGPQVRTFNFPGDREMVRDRAAKMALALLRFHLLGKQPPF